MTDEAKELFAEQAHIMWAHWMQYQFSVCVNHLDVTLEPTGGLLIPADMVERWRRQFETPYADLTEQERESDREQADRMSAALAAAGYPVEAMHAQLADIEEHGTAEINHAVALRGLLVEAIGLLRVIGDAADGPAGQGFPVTVQNGRHLTANHVAKCADLVGRARDAVSITPPSVAAGPALVEALEAAEKTLLEDGAPSFVGPDDMRIYQLEGGILSNTLNKIRAALALAKQEPQP